VISAVAQVESKFNQQWLCRISCIKEKTMEGQLTIQSYVNIFYLDLYQTFLKAKDLFNQRDWDDLRKLLDPDVILNKVDDPVGNQSVVGIDDVMNYLKNDVAKDKPQFTPQNPINVNSRTGVVSGTAMWLDHDTISGVVHTTNRPITYSFIFTLRRPSAGAPRQWFISNLYASPD
jgi:hypothetical protein